jgi:hypothetical protein
VAAGELALSSSAGTTIQQALYSAPASNFNSITSGSNGAYTAAAGYNLVTGLGTPVANLLIPSLIAYQGMSPANAIASPNGVVNPNTIAGTNALAGRVFNVFSALALEAPPPRHIADHDRVAMPSSSSSDPGATSGARQDGTHGLTPFATANSGLAAVALGPSAPSLSLSVALVSAFAFNSGYVIDAGSGMSQNAASPAVSANSWFSPALRNNGDEVLIGGDGDDVLIGGDGRDILCGGFGKDKLQAGAGDDTFLSSHAH